MEDASAQLISQLANNGMGALALYLLLSIKAKFEKIDEKLESHTNRLKRLEMQIEEK